MDDQQRRAKDLDDYGACCNMKRQRADILGRMIDAALQDFGLAPAFLSGLDCCALRGRRSKISTRFSKR